MFTIVHRNPYSDGDSRLDHRVLEGRLPDIAYPHEASRAQITAWVILGDGASAPSRPRLARFTLPGSFSGVSGTKNTHLCL